MFKSTRRRDLLAEVARLDQRVDGVFLMMGQAAAAAGITIPGHEVTKPMPALRLVYDVRDKRHA